MNRVSEFGACPICGETDEMFLSPKNHYYFLRNKNGHSLVMVRCRRCDLSMEVYSFLSASNNYDILVGELKKKWAKLKH